MKPAMSFFRDKRVFGALAAGALLCGCNIGMAPSGGSAAQIEANFHNEKPEDQIRVIQGSPASPERKAQLIHDIEVKYGIKSSDSSAAGQTPPDHK